MFNALIDRFQAKFPPNRLAALAMGLLLPTVIVPASAFVTAWVPAHFPGLPAFTSGQLTLFALAGGAAAISAGITAGYKFIDGWQKDEDRLAMPWQNNDDLIEIAKIEAEAKKMVALVEAGHLPEALLDLVHGAPSEVDPSRRPLPSGEAVPQGVGGVASSSTPPHGDPISGSGAEAPVPVVPPVVPE
jgi:hypothetical protein